jgi:hypothetical protein
MKILLTIIAVFLSCNLIAEERGTGLEKSDYRKLHVTVKQIRPNSAVITRKAVKSRVEQKLRQAGILPAKDSFPYLYVTVKVIKNSFSINLEFVQKTYYNVKKGEKHKTYYSAGTTWRRGLVGLSENPSQKLIYSTLERLVNEFLIEYLRANGKKVRTQQVFRNTYSPVVV